MWPSARLTLHLAVARSVPRPPRPEAEHVHIYLSPQQRDHSLGAAHGHGGCTSAGHVHGGATTGRFGTRSRHPRACPARDRPEVGLARSSPRSDRSESGGRRSIDRSDNARRKEALVSSSIPSAPPPRISRSGVTRPDLCTGMAPAGRAHANFVGEGGFGRIGGVGRAVSIPAPARDDAEADPALASPRCLAPGGAHLGALNLPDCHTKSQNLGAVGPDPPAARHVPPTATGSTPAVIRSVGGDRGWAWPVVGARAPRAIARDNEARSDELAISPAFPTDGNVSPRRSRALW
uniref:Uncharacterized protein n=1 Tax=Setaria viridis TaxID=4556 RepID=A0A4U6U8T5_SETVI|nr:hypothetical protein SEVIR_6G186400v2 [Setaria viridis]